MNVSECLSVIGSLFQARSGLTRAARDEAARATLGALAETARAEGREAGAARHASPDQVVASRPVPVAPLVPAPVPPLLHGLTLAEIIFACADMKIRAIKEHRTRTGLGLRESKDAIDAFGARPDVVALLTEVRDIRARYAGAADTRIADLTRLLQSQVAAGETMRNQLARADDTLERLVAERDQALGQRDDAREARDLARAELAKFQRPAGAVSGA